MNGCEMKGPLRRAHRFSDYIWFSVVGWTPVLVACLAIADSSLLWVPVYLGVMLLLGFAEIGFLCRHCPYYRQQPGCTVHCKAMWGPTKWVRPKPGPLSLLDKAVLYFSFLLAFSFPIYWLAMQPEFLVIYLVSIAVMVLTLARYECNRCMFFDCPFNFVGEDVKAELTGDGTDESAL